MICIMFLYKLRARLGVSRLIYVNVDSLKLYKRVPVHPVHPVHRYSQVWTQYISDNTGYGLMVQFIENFKAITCIVFM